MTSRCLGFRDPLSATTSTTDVKVSKDIHRWHLDRPRIWGRDCPSEARRSRRSTADGRSRSRSRTGEPAPATAPRTGVPGRALRSRTGAGTPHLGRVSAIAPLAARLSVVSNPNGAADGGGTVPQQPASQVNARRHLHVAGVELRVRHAVCLPPLLPRASTARPRLRAPWVARAHAWPPPRLADYGRRGGLFAVPGANTQVSRLRGPHPWPPRRTPAFD
jgi:hypothetical protein